MGRDITHDYFSLTFDQSPPSSGRFDEQRIPVRIDRVGRLEIKITAQHVSKPLPPPPDTGHPGTPHPLRRAATNLSSRQEHFPILCWTPTVIRSTGMKSRSPTWTGTAT
jgi:hypothetical protein